MNLWTGIYWILTGKSYPSSGDPQFIDDGCRSGIGIDSGALQTPEGYDPIKGRALVEEQRRRKHAWVAAHPYGPPPVGVIIVPRKPA